MYKFQRVGESREYLGANPCVGFFGMVLQFEEDNLGPCPWVLWATLVKIGHQSCWSNSVRIFDIALFSASDCSKFMSVMM